MTVGRGNNNLGASYGASRIVHDAHVDALQFFGHYLGAGSGARDEPDLVNGPNCADRLHLRSRMVP